MNSYDIMDDFDKSIWNHRYGDKRRYPIDFTTVINHLTPEENQEAYKIGTTSRIIKVSCSTSEQRVRLARSETGLSSPVKYFY